MDKIKIFKAFSNETRTKIFEFLLEGKMCVSGIFKKLDITQPSVTQHLRVLQELGLVKSKKIGYWMHYSIDETGLTELIDELNEFIKTVQLKGVECTVPSSECPAKKCKEKE